MVERCNYPEEQDQKKTSSGVEQFVFGLYLLTLVGLITAVVFLVLEVKSQRIERHGIEKVCLSACKTARCQFRCSQAFTRGGAATIQEFVGYHVENTRSCTRLLALDAENSVSVDEKVNSQTK